jgi:hypothetical protein
VNPFTPEEDANEIWGEAFLRGKAKYELGQKEHNTDFWSAGASWYAKEMQSEALDSIAYIHHLLARLESVKSLARLMKEDDGMTLSMAATILDHIAGDHPPRSKQKHSKHD